jgi:hypothetical protein
LGKEVVIRSPQTGTLYKKSKKHKETSKFGGGRSKAVFTVLLIGFSPSLLKYGDMGLSENRGTPKSTRFSS